MAKSIQTKVWIGILAAFVLWGLMFGLNVKPFWLLMTISAGGLSVWAVYNDRNIFHSPTNITFGKSVLIGLSSAAVLYGIFYLGDLATQVFPFQDKQIESIYSTKSEAPKWVIGLLLLLVIGPGEEIFWRGFVQKHFSAKWGQWLGWFIAGWIYAIVHVSSFNFMLFGAAAFCGAFWGLLYKYTGSVIPGIISHAVWDVSIFVLFPMR